MRDWPVIQPVGTFCSGQDQKQVKVSVSCFPLGSSSNEELSIFLPFDQAVGAT